MNRRRVIGIDPGLTGGVGVLDFSDSGIFMGVLIYRTPTDLVRRGRKTAREYDVPGMRDLLGEVGVVGPAVCEAAIELQGARPGQRVVSMYRTGLGFGVCWALLVAAEVPFHIVAPAVWKRHHGLLRCDKRASRQRASQRFPALGHLARSDEGPAEALPLADYVAVRRVVRRVVAGNGPAVRDRADRGRVMWLLEGVHGECGGVA
jgi:hypothetical protein